MAKSLEIAPKRKIFYELLIKILKSQQKEEIEIEFEDLKILESKLNEFNDEFPKFNVNLLSKIEDFLDNLKILEKINDHIFLKEAIEQLNKVELKLDIEKKAISKLKGLIEARIEKIEGLVTEFSLDKDAISKALKDIIMITKVLISKIDTIYKDIINKRSLKEEELNEILENYYKLKKITEFKEFQDKFKVISRITRDKGLINSVSQINKSLNQNKINKKRANSLLIKNIFPKLNQTIILFIINTLGSQTIDDLNQRTRIPKDKLFQGILSILDRNEIEVIGEKEGQPIYSRIKVKSNIFESVNKNLKNLIDSRNKIDQDSELFNKIIENLKKFRNYSDLIDQFDERVFHDSISELTSKVQRLTLLVPIGSLDTSEEKIIDKIDAMIEALNLYRIKLTTEKKDEIQEISSDLEDKISRLILDSMDQDFERGQIISTIKKKGPSNIVEISTYTDLPKDRIYFHMIQLKKDNRVKIIGSKEGYDLYDVPKVKTEEELLIENLFKRFINLQIIQTNYGKAILDIKFNIDKIDGSLVEFFQELNDILTITYFNQQFDIEIYEEYSEKVKAIQETLIRIKGKVKLKKVEINFDELVPILVPATEDEYSHLIEPKQLIGFGTIRTIEERCLSCRSCQDICEESAVTLKNVWNLPLIFELSEEALNELPETKRMLIKTIKKMANKKPSNVINIPFGAIGYGRPEFEPMRCIACKKCVERCPNEAIEFEEVWNFPEIIKSASKSLIMED